LVQFVCEALKRSSLACQVGNVGIIDHHTSVQVPKSHFGAPQNVCISHLTMH
jgi:hypothetical protein